MAKKKSKVAKQKQKKAKSLTKKHKQIASKYNIPCNGISGSNITSNTNNQSNSRTKTPHNSPRDGKMKLDEIKLRRNTKGRVRPAKVTHNCIDGEKQDYIQEYKSLQERTLQQQRQKKQQQNTSSTLNNFTQPTFMTNQKPTTDELIMQTASQLNQQQFMSDDTTSSSNSTLNQQLHSFVTNETNHGYTIHKQQINQQNPNSTLLQTLASAKRKEQQMASLYNVNNNKNDGRLEKDKMKHNSFWALHDDDDSDDNGNEKKNTSGSSSQFAFAAPSFVVPLPLNGINNNTSSSSWNGSTNTSSKMNQSLNAINLQADGEDDPDL